MKSYLFKFALILVVVILGFINIKYQFFAFNLPRSQKNVEGSFRVMTYNVNGPSGSDDVEELKRGLINEIEKQNPDILCLQELSLITFKQIQTSLDSLFGYTDSMIIKHHSERFRIYSKKPIHDLQSYECDGIDTTGMDSITIAEIIELRKKMPVYSAEIEVEKDQWIKLFACHLRSSAYSTARRSMSDSVSWFDGLPLYLKNYKIGKQIRDAEAAEISTQLRSMNNVPVIVAGDLNDWSGSACLDSLMYHNLKDAWWEGGFGCGLTYNAWHLKLRLDHILYSPHFELLNVKVENTDFSDHYPLIADFKLKTN